MNSTMKKNLIYIFLLVILFAIIGFFITIPAIQNLSETKQTLNAKQAELDSLSEKVSILQKASIKKEENQEIIDKTNLLWPDSQDISKFMIQTENMAKKNNIVMENFTVSQSTDTVKKVKQAKKSIGFSFSSQADYPTTFNIIKDMENLDRFNAIDTINMLLKDNGILTININGKIYYGN